jgi:hypothetical protein
MYIQYLIHSWIKGLFRVFSPTHITKAKSNVLSLPGRVLVELPRPSALRKWLMHLPFKIIILDTKVF